MQHLRIYDKIGKIVDFAEFTPAGAIDKRYTQPVIYTTHDTLEVGKDISFEVVLANQASEDVQVKIKQTGLGLDSLPGLHSKQKYILKTYVPGSKCLSGTVYQREHHGDTTITTSFPWKHCFYVTPNN